MVGLYDYMDEDEKYMMTMEAVMNNKLSHLYMEFNKLMLEHQENLKAIEMKILMENGTESDLSDLYMFEAEDTKEKGKGILSSIFGAIRRFFKKIKDFLFGVKEEVPEDGDVTVSEDPDKLEADGQNLLKSFRSKGKIVAKVGAAAAGGAVVTVGAVKLKKHIGRLNSLVTELDEEMAKNDETIGDKSPEEQSKMKELATQAHNFGNRVLKIGNALKDGGKSLEKNIADKKSENNSRELSKQGVHVIKSVVTDHKGQKHSGEYRVDKSNGNIVWHEDNGKEADVEFDWAPKNVQRVAQKAKGDAAIKHKESAEKNENKQAINSVLKTISVKDPKSGYTFRVDGHTGNIIAVDKKHNTTRCSSVNDASKFFGGSIIDKRNMKKKLNDAIARVKDGIDTAKKAKEAMDENGMKYEKVNNSTYDMLADMINSL